MDKMKIEKTVKTSYDTIASTGSSNFCCRPAAIYSIKELEDIPSSVLELSSGCGNPVLVSDIREGEVVLDIGSGGGIDLFLAAKKVGETGVVIGVDASENMIERAHTSVKESKFKNIEIRKGEARQLPVNKRAVDVVISNCVISTIPEKSAVFREIYRVLKPGGRMIISDIIADGDIKEEKLMNSPEAWAKCIAGIPEKDYLEAIRNAKFENIEIIERRRVPFPDCDVLSLKVRAWKFNELHLCRQMSSLNLKPITPTEKLWSERTFIDYKMSTPQCCSTTYYCACSSY